MTHRRARKPESGKGEKGGHLRKPGADGAADPYLELLNLQQEAGNQAVSAEVRNSLPENVQDVKRSPGRPLDEATRSEMEARFAKDFGDVRLHTDARAQESAQELKAKAYTIGSDIVFNEGQHTPDTADGKKLLSHELSHVIQQREAGGQAGQTRMVNEPGDSWEQAAEAAAEGQSDVSVPAGAPPAVQRQDEDDSDIDNSSGIFRAGPGAVSDLPNLDDRNVDRFRFVATGLNEVSAKVTKENRRTRQVMRRLHGVERKKK